jgi:opacity protein-like surface antigen
MRLKHFVVGLLLTPAFGVFAQVAPSARVGGLPIGIGVGMSSYALDYSGGRMEGPVIRASVGLFHGVGIDGSARSLFMFTPSDLTRMQQSTFLAGAFYEAKPFFHVRPFARFGGGIGVIEFPSADPKYTRDKFTVYAPGGGAEYPITGKVYLRGEYEYQFWQKFQGPHDLNPNGVTLGVTYYVRGMHLRPHSEDF